MHNGMKTLHYVLEVAGLTMIVKLLEDICKLDRNACFMACICRVCMHHTLCEHSCAMTMKHKIILKFPPTLDPKHIVKSSAGRPRKCTNKDMYGMGKSKDM